MADGVFNIAKGRTNEYANRVDSGDPSTARLQLKLLSTAAADATMKDFDTFAAILAGTSVEATFTNYGGGITVAAADITITTDDSGDTQYYTISDQTWTSAGGATNNTLAKLIVCYDALGTDVDANLIPLTYHDFVATTNGNDLTADFGTKVFEAS